MRESLNLANLRPDAKIADEQPTDLEFNEKIAKLGEENEELKKMLSNTEKKLKLL